MDALPELRWAISIQVEHGCTTSVSSKFNKKFVVNSLIDDDFERFIKNAYKGSEVNVNLRRNLEVEVLPEFIKLFEIS